ncbi:MAG TPA: hypothetical protein VMT76_08255 [Puia sp.]|nr:hypothetical protein [Puia sp.]
MDINLQNRTRQGLHFFPKKFTAQLKKNYLKPHRDEDALQKLNEIAKSRFFSMHYKAKTNDPL